VVPTSTIRNPRNSKQPQFVSWVLLVGLLVCGCVRYQPRPLSPAQTANELESRSLTNSELREFLQKNLHRELTEWPARVWDFEMLTLAAFYYNPSLDVARAEWQVAVGGTKTAAERPNPTVSATGIYEPIGGGASPWIPGVIFDLPIETFGKRRHRLEQAQHLSEAARFNLAAAAWKVRSDLRNSLVEYVTAQERVDSLQRQVRLREEMMSRLEQQFRAGAISLIELNVQRLAMAHARADLADALRLQAETRPRLASALGVPASALNGASFSFEVVKPPAAEELTTPDARRMALLGRSDILTALADYAASQAALQLAVAKQYPDVHLTPGYSWNAGGAGENDWQLGVNLELPLLNQHQGAIAEASAQREASAARFLALQAKVIGEIEQAVASFRASETNVKALEGLAVAQEATQQSVTAEFQAGAVDRLEVLTGEIELNNTQLTRLEAQLKLLQAFGALEDAVQRPLDLPASLYESPPSKPQAANHRSQDR
jgi:cobalt-zinc-cadmium efflux system outer membrane protein